jgi:hypothetical protein
MRVRHVATRRNMLQHGCSMDAFRHSTARARAGRVGQRRHWLPLLLECIDSVESADDLGADARELVLGLERVRLRLPTADVSPLSEQTVYAAVAVQCTDQSLLVCAKHCHGSRRLRRRYSG